MNQRFSRMPIAASFCLHIFLVLMAFIYLERAPRLLSNDSDPIEITLKDAVRPVPPTETPDVNKMVVQKSLGTEVEKAKKDAYLSDRTREVKVEVSARSAGEVEQSAAARKEANNTDSSKPNQPVKLSDLGVKIVSKPKEEFNRQRQWADAQTGETLRGGQYIQGLKEGEVSALNTKEFVFYSYFDRVRKQLDQAWQPILRENIARIFSNGRRLASNANYVTRTLVVLDRKGSIVRVQILEASGTHEMDQAAVDALNRAGPYLNPPKGLIDDSGLVQIHWDFILKT